MAHKTRQLQMIVQHNEKQWLEEGRHMLIYHYYDQQQGGEEDMKDPSSNARFLK